MNESLRNLWRLPSFSVALLPLLLNLACASTPAVSAPATPQASENKAPAWTLNTPPPSGGYTYFVGYADGPENGEAQATDNATAGLINEIMRYIGVTISAQSTATAKSTLDSYQADLVQTVKQSSNNRVSGFQIAEKYVAKRSGGVTVYILGKYATKDLEAEKQRIAAVFQEKIDAVAVPEAEGKKLLAQGDAINAVKKFIDAASAASGSDIDNASVKFERNINNAKEALGRITIEKLNDRLQSSVGVKFPSPFRAAVKSDGKPLPQVSLVVGYQSRLANGRMTTKTANITTDNDGVASFDHPSPDFVGKATLTMRLDLSAAMESLYNINDKFSPLVSGLDDAIAEKRVSFEYSVISKAREIPTAVVIVDLDASGNPIGGTTSAALLQTLSKNGFKVSSAPLQADALVGKDDPAVLQAAKTALGNRAERLVFGTTKIVSVKDDRGQKIVTVSAEVKALDLATGQILYSAIKQVPAIASTEKEAADSARRQLGQKTIGDDLASQLP